MQAPTIFYSLHCMLFDFVLTFQVFVEMSSQFVALVHLFVTFLGSILSETWICLFLYVVFRFVFGKIIYEQ